MSGSGDPGDYEFGPGTQTWRVGRENAVLIGGVAATILQVAHPEIAAGVAAHSRFRDDAFGRLHRTLEAVHGILFSTRDEAAAHARRVAALHAKVRGDRPVPHDAFSPDAQMWVLATLHAVALEIYARVARPLDAGEREAHYAEMRRFGAHFGLDPAFGPQDEAEFRRYYEGVLGGDLLCSHPVCREVAWAVVRPASPAWSRPLGISLPMLAAETLPRPVAHRLGFRSTLVSRALCGAGFGAIRAALPVLPPAIRFNARYRAAASGRARRAP